MITDDANNQAAGRHPLPRSDEARHDRIPEHLEREKGRGDDSRARVQPADAPVDPEGEAYGAAASKGR